MKFAFMVVLFTASFALGVLVGKRGGRSVKLIVCATALFFILVNLVLSYSPSTLAILAQSDLFFYFLSFWFVPFVLLLFGIGVVQARSVILRDAVLVVGVLLVLWHLQDGWFHSFIGYEYLHGKKEANGLCRQSTWYSCAPASCVNVLDLLGISSTERECAEWAGTTSRGTSSAGICRALNNAFRSRSRGTLTADVSTLVWDDFKRFPLPYIVTIRLSVMVGHAIVVVDIRDDRITVIDPLSGRKEISKEEFIGGWTGETVFIVRLSE